jgi:hypothetical protein
MAELSDFVLGWFSKPFTASLLVLWICFWLLIYAAANGSYLYGITPAGQSLANDTLNERNQTWQTWTTSWVFANNLKETVRLVIPGVGLVWFLFPLYSTGQFIGLLAAATGTAPWLFVLGLAMSTVGILEIGAYALLAAESTYVLYLYLIKQHPVDRIKTYSWLSFLLYVGLLLVAAWLEVN